MNWNINRQKTEQENLRQRIRTLEAMGALFPGHVWTARPDGSPEYLSQSIREYTGIQVSNTSANYDDVIHPDDVAANEHYWEELAAGRDPGELEFRIRRADGVYRWFLCRMRAVRGLNGALVGWVCLNWDINDRKIAESRRRSEGQNYRRIVDCVPACVCVADPAGNLVYVNKVGLAALGRPSEEVVGDLWMNYIHPTEVEAARAQWAQCIEAGRPVDVVVRMQQYDGAYRWQHLIAEPFYDEGAIVNWYLVVIEVDDAVKAQEILKKNEREAREIVDAMPVMIWRATPSGEIDRWNRRMLSFIGKTWEEIDGKPLFSLVPPDERERVHKHWQQCVLEGSSYQDTYQITGADGKLHWYLVRGEPFRDETGEILHWYGVCAAIDDLKETEVALQQREHQLREITETIPAMIWCADADGQPTYYNRRHTEYAGTDISETRDLGYKKLIHPDDWESVIQRWTHSIQTGEPHTDVFRMRGMRREDGQYRWHQVRAEAMRDADGNIVQWYGLNIDIDEQKCTEDSLREVQTQLARATRIATVAELSASIAHELNQPLTSVIANAHACRRWLATNPPNLDEVRSSVECILRDGHAADETMQSIRTLFKRESLKKSQCSIPDMVRDAVKLLKEDPTMRDAAIMPEFPNNLPDVNVDQIQIQQVLINLLSNAIEATENTGRTPQVGITGAFLDELLATIEISDNGDGIAELDTLFEPFVTSKAKGMGIGLAISRSIIEAHDGTLTARNNLDQGATFSLTLPIFALSGNR